MTARCQPPSSLLLIGCRGVGLGGGSVVNEEKAQGVPQMSEFCPHSSAQQLPPKMLIIL